MCKTIDTYLGGLHVNGQSRDKKTNMHYLEEFYYKVRQLLDTTQVFCIKKLAEIQLIFAVFGSLRRRFGIKQKLSRIFLRKIVKHSVRHSYIYTRR